MKLRPLSRTATLALVMSPVAVLAQAQSDNWPAGTVLSALPVSQTGDITDATLEIDEPLHLGHTTGRSLWWRWQAPSTGVFRIDTTGSAATADTRTAVYSGDSLATLVLFGQNDNADAGTTDSVIYLRATAGTIYDIAVDTATAGTGTVALNITAQSAASVASNDDFSTPTVLPATLPVNVSASNTVSSWQAGEPAVKADMFSAPSVWFRYTPTATATVQVAATVTAGGTMDPQVAVWTGNSVGALTRVAALSPFTAVAGTSYLIQVAGTGVNGQIQRGNFNLTITSPSPVQTTLLPMGSAWEWLHPLDGVDPAGLDPSGQFAATWYRGGVAYQGPAFNAAAPAPLGFDVIARAPGVLTDIGTPVDPDPDVAGNQNNHAAYFRRTFTLSSAQPNVWAEILADDGAWIYVDNNPPVQVNIRQTDGVPDPDAFLLDDCAAANATLTEEVTKTVYLGALGAGSHTIGVSLHQVNLTSSDMGFDLRLYAADPSFGNRLTSAGLFTGFQEAAVGATLFIPTAASTELGWTVTAGSTPGGTAKAAGSVQADANTGVGNQVLKVNNQSALPFRTAAIDVNGISSYKAAVKLRAFTSSGTGFEATDSIRVALEVSDDGISYTDPGPGAGFELIPEIVGDTSTATPADAILREYGPGAVNSNPDPSTLVERTLVVNNNTHKSVRLIISTVNDSASENFLFDDVRFTLPQCNVVAAVADVVRNTQGDDSLANDTFTFTTTVTNEDAGRTTWVSNDPGHPAGSYNQFPITFGPYPVTGGTKSITFTDGGLAGCNATITVAPPACEITSTLLDVVRAEGPTTAASDDTFTFSLMVDGVNAATGWTSNAAGHATGTYGQLVSFGPFPATAPRVITFADKADPACTHVVTVSPPPRYVVGTATLGATAVDVISTIDPAPGAGWVNDAGLKSLTLNSGDAVVYTQPLDLSAVSGAVFFQMKLEAITSSTGSNFEAADTFKAELILNDGAGDSIVNLITPYDVSANGLMNGADDLPYVPAEDEFNSGRVALGDTFDNTFIFNYTIPDNIVSAQVVITGINNSTTETFIVSGLTFGTQNLGSADDDGDGMSNTDEIIAGTDPANPASVLRITSLNADFSIISPGQPLFIVEGTFPSVLDRFYRIYVSTDLQNWLIDENVSSYAGSGAPIEFTTLSQDPAAVKRLFYRVHVMGQDGPWPVTLP